MPVMNAQAIAQVFAGLDREIWIVTAANGGRRGGLAATFVSQASIAPEAPRVLVGLAHGHHTTGLVSASGALAMHLIDETQLDWVWRFGTQSGRETDKLDGCELRQGETGSPLLIDALAWLDCRVETEMDTGDRVIFLAEVIDGGWRQAEDGAKSLGAKPLTVDRMLALAPEENRRQLKEQTARDAQRDVEAIRAWRGRKRT